MSKDKANERINSKEAVRHTKKSHSGALAVVAIGVILVLIGVILFLVTKKEPVREYNRVVTADNVDQIISQLEEEERTPVGYYTVTMNTNWEFPSGDAVSTNAFVENSTANQNTVYFTISPKGNSDTVWYTSPYLEVGSRLDGIKLDTVLGAGEYDAVMTYHLVDERDKEISSLSLYMTLTIKN